MSSHASVVSPTPSTAEPLHLHSHDSLCPSRITRAAQVVLEQRLGIAQLCLLMAVLLFIGLTRGAPAQHPPTLHRLTREWGVRNLCFGSSTDGWNPLRRQSYSPVEEIVDMKAKKKVTGDYKFLNREAFLT